MRHCASLCNESQPVEKACVAAGMRVCTTTHPNLPAALVPGAQSDPQGIVTRLDQDRRAKQEFVHTNFSTNDPGLVLLQPPANASTNQPIINQAPLFALPISESCPLLVSFLNIPQHFESPHLFIWTVLSCPLAPRYRRIAGRSSERPTSPPPRINSHRVRVARGASICLGDCTKSHSSPIALPAFPAPPIYSLLYLTHTRLINRSTRTPRTSWLLRTYPLASPWLLLERLR